MGQNMQPVAGNGDSCRIAEKSSGGVNKPTNFYPTQMPFTVTLLPFPQK
jgi:hypothetical protein